MERKLVEVGHRVEAQPGCGLIPDITHTIPGRGGGKIGADAKGRDTVQSSLQRAVVVTALIDRPQIVGHQFGRSESEPHGRTANPPGTNIAKTRARYAHYLTYHRAGQEEDEKWPDQIKLLLDTECPKMICIPRCPAIFQSKQNICKIETMP